MNKVEKIKAEIGIRIAEICDLTTGCIMDSKTAAEYRLLYELSSFIDSLEEEPISNDLEEAACEYDNSHIDDNNLAFKAGAGWQKEKMMEGAVDGEIYFSMDYLQYRINTEPLAHFHHGDKVKLIIVKEE